MGSCLLHQLHAFEGGILLDLPQEIEPSHVKFTRGERTVARVGGSSPNRFAHLLRDTSMVGSHTVVESNCVADQVVGSKVNRNPYADKQNKMSAIHALFSIHFCGDRVNNVHAAIID